MANTKTSQQVSPNGRRLVDLVVPTGVNGELKAFASRLPSLQISEPSVCDLELLWAFSPPAQTRITGEKAPKPSVRDPPSGMFCSVKSDMERLPLSQCGSSLCKKRHRQGALK